MSNENVMPTFELPTLDEDQVQEITTSLTKKGSTRLQPGLYAFEITEAAFTGATRKDDTWFKLELTLALTGDQKVKDTIIVPTKGYTYGEEGSLYPLNKLLQFLKGIGEPAEVPTLKSILPRLMAKGGVKLVGRKGNVKLDYNTNHLEKVDGKIVLLDRKGKPVKDANNEVLEFPDFSAGQAYCQDNGIDQYGFVKPVAYAAPTETKKVSNSDF